MYTNRKVERNARVIKVDSCCFRLTRIHVREKCSRAHNKWRTKAQVKTVSLYYTLRGPPRRWITRSSSLTVCIYLRILQ